MGPIIGAMAIIGVGYLFSSVKIISQGYEALVERLGRFNRKLTPGMSFLIPPIERIVFKDTIREQVLDVPPQQCITNDNVSLTADAVVYWRITDMVKTYYAVEDVERALVNLVLTTLRSEIGRLELDETFSSRVEINARLLAELDDATDPWGIKVTRVEVKDINPSRTVQDSMEKQMAAEREKRAAILASEGEQQANVNQAEGLARARVLRAEAEKQEKLLRAQGTAEALTTIATTLHSSDEAEEALQFLLAQNYIDMGLTVGRSDSAKVVFMDPHSIPGTLQGMMSMLDGVPSTSGKPKNGTSTKKSQRPRLSSSSGSEVDLGQMTRADYPTLD